MKIYMKTEYESEGERKITKRRIFKATRDKRPNVDTSYLLFIKGDAYMHVHKLLQLSNLSHP